MFMEYFLLRVWDNWVVNNLTNSTSYNPCHCLKTILHTIDKLVNVVMMELVCLSYRIQCTRTSLSHCQEYEVVVRVIVMVD